MIDPQKEYQWCVFYELPKPIMKQTIGIWEFAGDIDGLVRVRAAIWSHFHITETRAFYRESVDQEFKELETLHYDT